MYGIFIVTYIWLIFMVNVGKYIIHGSYGYIRRLYIFLGNFYFLQKHLAISILKKTAKLASRLGDLHKWKNTPIFFRGSQWMSWSFFFTQKSGTFQEGKEGKKPTKNKPILHCSAPEFLGSCGVFLLRFLKNFALNGVCCGPNGLLTAWGPSPVVVWIHKDGDQSTPFLQHSNGGETGLFEGCLKGNRS